MGAGKRNARGQIVTAAWKLFYEQGYNSTSVEDILRVSGTAKGTFYRYFNGKDALLETLSTLFDEKYTALAKNLPPDQNSFDTLLYLNRELFWMIETSLSLDLLTRLFSTQLTTGGEKHLLDHNRVYYRLLRQIVLRGQERGELSRTLPAAEIVKAYALCERALLYDWCLLDGEYSLSAYSARMMPRFLQFIREKQKENRIVAPIS